MNLNNILDSINSENDKGGRDRRDFLKSLGGKLAMAVLPLAAVSVSRKASAQTASEQHAALNLILKWTRLGIEFYSNVLGNEDLFTDHGESLDYLKAIQKQKAKHIDFLQHIIANAGGTVEGAPAFDLSGGKGSTTGPFAESLTDYKKMLALAQTIEDTTIRTVKGQLTMLMTNDDLLAGAGRVHTVTGRHSALIRILRRHSALSTVRPWITGGNGLTDNSYMQAYYNGEAVVSQVGVNIVGLNGQAISFDTASEAFDEPMDGVISRQMLDPFVV